LRLADFASLDDLVGAGRASDHVLYVLPAARIPELLPHLREFDDVCPAEAGDAGRDHRARRLELAAMADRDAITGLWNRSRLLTALDRWPPVGVDRPVRSIVLVDLDRFKSINAQHGHLVGDEILGEVAARLSAEAPDSSVVARIGGEEMVVLARLGREEATQLAERVCAAIRTDPFLDGIEVTASVSVATGGPDQAGQELLSEADEAMYACKAGGRDCVRHFHDVRRSALEADIDPQIQGFENLTRVISERVADVLARRGRRLFEEVQAQADHDKLTGLFSRRYLERRLAFDLGDGRPDGPLSAAMIDVDFFGRVNKRHGWPTGDAVLAGIARRITEELRSTDWVARYGGEEILIVMRDTEVTGAADVLERIRTSVAASPFVGPGGEQVAVTISAGVAEAEAAEDIGSLKERLSGALLVAKRGGRNRVVSV